ncbi:MAG: helix-turn-helix transcriptional regulator [Roseibium sp.]
MGQKDHNWTKSHSQLGLSSRRIHAIKLAAALRAGRSTLGLSQTAFAREIGISKSKLARAETAVGGFNSDDLEAALRFFQDYGVVVDLLSHDEVTVRVTPEGIEKLDALFISEAPGGEDE